MALLTGITADGLEVPVQVKPDGRLVAEGLTGAAGTPGAQGPAGARGEAGVRANANVLINGAMLINQREVTIAAAAVGQYGPDRWKKVDAGHMTQVVEDGNFEPGATYTLSGTGVTTQQLVAPATGHWTLPNIPIAATKIQLELGTVATPFERRPIGTELALCQRYYHVLRQNMFSSGNASIARVHVQFPTSMRTTPVVLLTTATGGALDWACPEFAQFYKGGSGVSIELARPTTFTAEL